MLTAACSGGSSFCIPPDIQHAFRLTEGMELSDEETYKLQHACRVHLAEEKSVALLASREHSRKELEQKLMQRKFAPDEIAPALDVLEDKGLLSDRRFAQQWARSRVERTAEGPIKIAAGLQARGIDETLAREVIEELMQIYDLSALMRRSYDKVLPKSRGSRERLASSLVRKGFAYRDVKKFLEESGEDG